MLNDPRAEYARAKANNADVWVPGCQGTEPVTEFNGRRLQYCWNPRQGRHAYYDLDNDLILIDGLEYLLPDFLK
jgi:hypothetical protein